jgi:hypothetical protein
LTSRTAFNDFSGAGLAGKAQATRVCHGLNRPAGPDQVEVDVAPVARGWVQDEGYHLITGAEVTPKTEGL